MTDKLKTCYDWHERGKLLMPVNAPKGASLNQAVSTDVTLHDVLLELHAKGRLKGGALADALQKMERSGSA